MTAVLVTGAAGSIGSELTRQLTEKFDKIYAVDSCEKRLFEFSSELLDRGINHVVPILCDLAADYAIQSILGKVSDIQSIFHAAAYKHVNMSQSNELSYMYNNVVSTVHAIDLAKHFQCPLIHISTDKAVNPTNVMGMSKRICEFLVFEAGNVIETFVVRFGNVLNSAGSVVPIFLDQISRGGPVTVTDKTATRFFMSIQDAVALVVDCQKVACNDKPVVLDMGPPILIDQLAKNLCEERGLKIVTKKTRPDEIEITYIGMRLGEKLHEELSYNDLQRSSIDCYFIANEETSCNKGFTDEVVRKIRKLEKLPTDKINWMRGCWL